MIINFHEIPMTRSASETPGQLLTRYMGLKGLKTTRQRSLILDAFLETEGHASVDDLLAVVRSADPHVSAATVYRTMKLLTECGLARAQQFGDGQTRFERSSKEEHHDHLLCTRCGAIEEFEDDRIEALQAEIARARGYQLTRHRMDLFGVCRTCQRADQKSALSSRPS